MFSNIKQLLGNQSDLILAFSMIGILLILFTPIPPALLDLFLITNFSFALLILLLTFYVDKPLDFSTFPSLLLIATLFRLALNISATRLILADADAGQVMQRRVHNGHILLACAEDLATAPGLRCVHPANAR